MLDMWLHIERHSRLLSDEQTTHGVANLMKFRALWQRPVQNWKPAAHNTECQFSPLTRHLFANYKVPSFMDSVWYEDEENHQGWFVHVGLGKNIRSAEKLPVVMTKKMAHWYLQAPDHCCAVSAMRWSQIRALGGCDRVANAVLATRLSRNLRHDDFWQSVIRFVIDNPMMDLVHVNPIIDYIWHRKFENQLVHDDAGTMHQEGPPLANFSMQGRTAESLLRQVTLWHQQLGRESRGGTYQWKKRNVDDFVFASGDHKTSNYVLWNIHELLSSRELVAEGRKQQHCVASYARSCHSGRSAIFTIDRHDHLGREKHLTIEIDAVRKQIIQLRGFISRVERLPNAFVKSCRQGLPCRIRGYRLTAMKIVTTGTP